MNNIATMHKVMTLTQDICYVLVGGEYIPLMEYQIRKYNLWLPMRYQCGYLDHLKTEGHYGRTKPVGETNDAHGSWTRSLTE